jgi:hypothetical protein
LASLAKKIDSATEANKSSKMGSFIVLLSDDDKLESKIKEFAEKEKIKKTMLGIDNPAGPEGYGIAKDAEITVVLYAKKKVVKTFAFKKGELTEKDIDTIVGSVKEILPEKK